MAEDSVFAVGHGGRGQTALRQADERGGGAGRRAGHRQRIHRETHSA